MSSDVSSVVEHDVVYLPADKHHPLWLLCQVQALHSIERSCNLGTVNFKLVVDGFA